MNFQIEAWSSSSISPNIKLKIFKAPQHQDPKILKIQKLRLILFKGLPKPQHKRKMPRHNTKMLHVTILVRRSSSANPNRKKMKVRKKDLHLKRSRRATIRPQERNNVKKTKEQKLIQEECHQ